MPAMPRSDGKAKKIAYAILGEPDNIASKKSSTKKKQDKELVFQDLKRIK